MDLVLVAGLWLDASAWDDVNPVLEELGHRPVPVTLPGQGDGTSSATLDDQVAAVVAAVDSTSGPVLLVGHSAACSLAWAGADARPEKVARVALVGGFPKGDGESYADFFPPTDGVVPFPGWEPFEGPDIADLDEETRRAVAARAVPVPEAVTRGTMRLSDPRRYDVPVTMVCPEYSPAEAKEWIAAGEIPEVAKAANVDFVDLDSGHWPMYSCPRELARVVADLAS